MSGKVLAWISPATPWATPWCSSTTFIDHAAQAVHIATADFFIAIQDAKTSSDALRIVRTIADVLSTLTAAENAALARADVLNGQSGKKGA